MSTFIADKFDPDTDPDRPVVGSTIHYQGKDYEIVKVGWKTTKELVEEVLFSAPKHEELDGCDEICYKDHITRPFVSWVVWIKKV